LAAGINLCILHGVSAPVAGCRRPVCDGTFARRKQRLRGDASNFIEFDYT
jgi:hypothetical protein